MAFQFPKASSSFSLMSPPPMAVRRPGKPRLLEYAHTEMSLERDKGGSFSMFCLHCCIWCPVNGLFLQDVPVTGLVVQGSHCLISQGDSSSTGDVRRQEIIFSEHSYPSPRPHVSLGSSQLKGLLPSFPSIQWKIYAFSQVFSRYDLWRCASLHIPAIFIHCAAAMEHM